MSSKHKDNGVSAYTPIRTKSNSKFVMGNESDLAFGISLNGAKHDPKHTKPQFKKGETNMDMSRLLESVKKHEGYRNKVYLDTLGKRTVGVGHLCVEEFWEDDKEYEEKFLMDILEADLQNAINGAERLCSNCPDIDDLAKEIIIEMVFQLGETGVSKFKNMWKALEQDPPEYITAAMEMLDSRWAKQTPNRAEAMSAEMAGIG